MKKICAITMVRNDSFFLKRWINYYGSQLGFENLFVLLDGEDQNVPINKLNVNFKKYKKVEGLVVEADRARMNIINNEAQELFNNYDLIIGTDIDEFLLVNPKCNLSLIEYLNSVEIKTCISGLGIDVGQHLKYESELNTNIHFLKQRKYALLSSRYTKPSVITKGLKWGSGFHRVKGKNFTIDKNLYLFHFGCVDLKIIENKFLDTEKIQSGWKKHLNKRTRTIKLISNKKPIKSNNIFFYSRIIQTLLRPPYAWNKPSMGCFKFVVEIPEQFRINPLF